MKIIPKSLSKLIESFEKLPGIGPKTAGRLAFYLLHVPQNELNMFSDNIKNLKIATKFCSLCGNIGETDPCSVCEDVSRDHSFVCVVEQPLDVVSIEKTGAYKGVYHVLYGAINPLQNIGPDEIRIAELMKRIFGGTIHEILLATNPTMEGEATAMYIKREIQNAIRQLADKSQNSIRITRLAHGLPVGGDIEYADEVTLSRAFEGRREY
ncbi:recombination protein RecR [Candidatus Gottesmanbacteria bacterium]|nr:recombination protein RecR [Candidatus Gottesmanbacteria bacterium]